MPVIIYVQVNVSEISSERFHRLTTSCLDTMFRVLSFFGIIGLGRIGSALALRAGGFGIGVQILYFKKE
jgi:lactate dehydrogenase-like 2-hydroxyacid dehydrogenase